MIGTRRSTIIKQAKDNNSIYQSQTHRYVDRGRTYQSDIYDGPRKMRSDVIQHLAYNEIASASDLFRIEQYLRGEMYHRKQTIKDKERKAIVEKYHLVKDEKDGKWKGNYDQMFAQLCEEFPAARSFKNFTALLYEMRYGDSRNGPVVIHTAAEGG